MAMACKRLEPVGFSFSNHLGKRSLRAIVTSEAAKTERSASSGGTVQRLARIGQVVGDHMSNPW
jgi:hypothetical protein